MRLGHQVDHQVKPLMGFLSIERIAALLYGCRELNPLTGPDWRPEKSSVFSEWFATADCGRSGHAARRIKAIHRDTESRCIRLDFSSIESGGERVEEFSHWRVTPPPSP